MNKYIILLITCFLSTMCKDLQDFPLPDDHIKQEGGTTGMYVLCEGLYAQNSSSLAYYNFKDENLIRDIFLSVNGRKVGDTANDMQQYGSLIYVVVDNSGTIEVINSVTGQSVKKIEIRDAANRNRSPRYITFHKGKAYVACFDSYVCRIDTATFQVEAVVKAGTYPDGICVANNKLYVSNSGDREFTTLGNTVSVIDIASFTKIKEIAVAANPYRIMADSDGDVYLACRGNYKGSGPYVFQRVSSLTDEVLQTFNDIEALNFTILNDTAYIYHYDFEKQINSIKTFDCLTESIIEENFITDGTDIQTPYGISVNADNGDVYITDAGSFTATGDLFCFSRAGKLKFKIRDVGLNPNAIVFTHKVENSGNITMKHNHVTRVFDYHPAPGQFNGEGYLPTEKTIETVLYSEILTEIAGIVTDPQASGGVVSLGGWGGYITVGFDEPIKNTPGKRDFKVLGNAYHSKVNGHDGGSCEPGIVLVAKDVNGNGLPDDEWFELAGSEYHNPLTIHDYEITYYKPSPLNADVHWTDNKGNEGTVNRNIFHKQTSYFPVWENTDQLVFKGSRLPDNGEKVNGTFVLFAYNYGYADNQPNEDEGSDMDIAWAVNAQGEPVELDQINFVCVYSAINQYNGQIGEVSTEFGGIRIIE